MVARMVAGIDVIMYRPDDELRRLARLAVDCGVDDLFTEGCSPDAALPCRARHRSWTWAATSSRTRSSRSSRP
jgi:pyruvate,water dikinase